MEFDIETMEDAAREIKAITSDESSAIDVYCIADDLLFSVWHRELATWLAMYGTCEIVAVLHRICAFCWPDELTHVQPNLESAKQSALSQLEQLIQSCVELRAKANAQYEASLAE